MILVYFYIMLTIAVNPNPIHLDFAYAGIIFNLYLLFGGILKNPGVPQSYIDRELKI